MRRRRDFNWLLKILCLLYFVPLWTTFCYADSTTVTAESSSLVVTRRDLQQFDLADIVLISTLDGSLQARSRESGHVLWSLQSSPLVSILETIPRESAFPFGDTKLKESESKITWLAEPSENGGLYYFTADGGVERIPASVRDLVQRAPFGMEENIVYTGSKQTTLYALDVHTGEILRTFGDLVEMSSPKSDIDSTKVLMIGRTEYTLDIHENVSSPGWRIRISIWSPNTRDQDLEMQYSGAMDSVYITPLTNSTIMALAENDMRPQRWLGEVPSLLVDVFDILRSKSDNYLSLVRQPPLKLSGMSTEWDIYVAETPAGSPVVVSGPRYAALLTSAPNSDFCEGTGKNIQGVHPIWCQEKRRPQNSKTPAISLLPPLSTPVNQYPRLDPPMDLDTLPENVSRWPFVKRVLENVGIVAIILLLLIICASQGWLPVDVVSALQKLAGTAGQKLQQQKSLNEEPKKRKRGTRGGRRTNTNGSTNSANNYGGNSNNTNHSRDKDPEKEKEKEKEKDKVGRDSIPISMDSPITISDTVLGYGSHGTTVFKGRFEDRDVAVKRMLLEFYDVASQEVDILRDSDDHPNVVRYFCKYETDQFLYIALELCPGTLEDLVRRSIQYSVLYEPLDALRQISLGLRHLHSLQIVHRDIKPQNILVALPTGRTKGRKSTMQTLGVRYLISDFGLCRRLEGEQSSFLPTVADSVAGTAGWAAPEIINQDPQGQYRLTRAVDIFSMGCLFYYVLTGGKHPFGDEHMRQVNIKNRRPPSLESGGLVTPEAMDIIPQMLSFNPKLRPDTQRILRHPLFWTDSMKLDLLIKVSDRLEHESREEHSDLIDRLELHAADVVGEDWHAKFPRLFVENLGKYRRYHGDRILDLLRALRNKLHHYNDFSDDLKQCVGSVPSGYLSFFTSRFPNLLMTVYYYAEREFKDEDSFHTFYNQV